MTTPKPKGAKNSKAAGKRTAAEDKPKAAPKAKRPKPAEGAEPAADKPAAEKRRHAVLPDDSDDSEDDFAS